MNRSEINEGNEIIARFTGKNFSMCCISDFKSGQVPKQILSKLKYHRSWDEIIPAIRKWDNLPINKFSKSDAKIYVEMCDVLDDYVTLYATEKVFMQLVKNIKWYNSIK